MSGCYGAISASIFFLEERRVLSNFLNRDGRSNRSWKALSSDAFSGGIVALYRSISVCSS